MTFPGKNIRKHKLLAGMAAGVVLFAVFGGVFGLYLLLGGFNTAADAPHSPMVGWAMHTTMKHSVKARAPRMARPVAVSAKSLMAGAAEYREYCVECHGGPGVARAHWVQGMLPTPPFLLDAGKRWTRGELFEIVDHGVKMTGMPAWGEVMPRDEVDDVVTFVEYLPAIKPAEFSRLMHAAKSSEDDEREAPSADATPGGHGRQG